MEKDTLTSTLNVLMEKADKLSLIYEAKRFLDVSYVSKNEMVCLHFKMIWTECYISTIKVYIIVPLMPALMDTQTTGQQVLHCVRSGIETHEPLLIMSSYYQTGLRIKH